MLVPITRETDCLATIPALAEMKEMVPVDRVQPESQISPKKWLPASG